MSREIDMEYEEEEASLRTIALEQAERDAQDKDFMKILLTPHQLVWIQVST